MSAPFAALAQLPSARLDTIFPPGGRHGSEVEVVITGSDLEEGRALHFSHPAISTVPKGDKKFALTIPPEVPVGRYDVRAVGRFGVSNRRVFVVSDGPELVEAAPNHKLEAAVELPLGAVFNGTVAAAADDHFKLTAKQGQRLFIACVATEIDSRLMPVMTLLDPAGQELAVNRRGGVLDFMAPADGAYLLRLHDLTYAGGAEHFFRLAMTSGPHLDFVLPSSAMAGTRSKFTVFGRSLPGGTPSGLTSVDGKLLERLEMEIDVPADAQVQADGLGAVAGAVLPGFSYRLITPEGTSNPVFISFGSASPVAEIEPNNQAAEAQRLAVPSEVSGQFYPAHDVDVFTFEAKKGDIFWLEVFSRRLGLPTHPFLLIQREAADVQEVYGSEADPGGKRFPAAAGDPAWRFEVKDDGVYRVQVRDLFGALKSDPQNVYRLAIRRETPDFHLVAVPEVPPKKDDDRSVAPRGFFLRGGETAAIRVVAFRRDGFGREITLGAEGLPAGVTCGKAKIPAGKDEGLLLLTAGEQAGRWVGPIRVLGKATIGDADRVREARGGAVTWSAGDYNNDAVLAGLTRDFPIAVDGAAVAPMSIEAVEEKTWEIAAGGKLEIPLKITRRGEFSGALKLKAFGAAGIETLKEIDVEAKAVAVTAVIDLAALKIPAGEHAIYFRSQTKGKVGAKEPTFFVYSAPICIVVK